MQPPIASQLSPERNQRLEQLLRVPVYSLASALSLESKKFVSQGQSDDLVGLALFTLAVAQRSEAAWSVLYQQYAPLVLTWVAQHRSATPLLRQDGSGPLVNAAFAKFSRALTPAKMDHFDSLAGILKYLKMCVHSVVADEVRSRQSRHYEETLELIEQEPAGDDPADAVVSALSVEGLWQVIQEELNGNDELVVMHLTYIQDMKPREISKQHPHLFPTLDDVYRVKRNVLERLRRNPHLQRIYACS